MTVGDLPLLQHWMLDPDVRHWFRSDDLSPDGIDAHYRPKLLGETPEEQWLGLVDGTAVAWLQTYAIAPYPEYARPCVAAGADPGSAGLDYLLGDATLRGRGIGSALIGRFVEEVVFGLHPEWPMVCSGAHPDNVRSWRALEKAGFRLLGVIETEDGPERLMGRTQPLT
jgi:aminoglycoside 6'-N-acetyltransferase